MMKIFISYRRRESAYIAAVISEKLSERFGHDAVFLDVDNIPLGVDFRDYIGNAVGQCHVLLVIMGDEWVEIRDEQGARRIDKPTDHVRVEIESALKRNIPIIPVLVDQAMMPAAGVLPESLQPLVFRNAAEVRPGRDLRQHLDRLIEGLDVIAGIGIATASATTESADAAPIVTASTTVSQIDATSSGVGRSRPRRRKKAAATVSQMDPDVVLFRIRECLRDFSDSSLFVGSIPSAKLAGALVSYGVGVSPDQVVLLYDDTVFGGAKDGFFLTHSGIHWHNIWDSPKRLSYSEIKSVGVSSTSGILVNEENISITGPNKGPMAIKGAELIRLLTGCSALDQV